MQHQHQHLLLRPRPPSSHARTASGWQVEPRRGTAVRPPRIPRLGHYRPQARRASRQHLLERLPVRPPGTPSAAPRAAPPHHPAPPATPPHPGRRGTATPAARCSCGPALGLAQEPQALLRVGQRHPARAGRPGGAEARSLPAAETRASADGGRAREHDVPRDPPSEDDLDPVLQPGREQRVPAQRRRSCRSTPDVRPARARPPYSRARISSSAVVGVTRGVTAAGGDRRGGGQRARGRALPSGVSGSCVERDEGDAAPCSSGTAAAVRARSAPATSAAGRRHHVADEAAGRRPVLDGPPPAPGDVGVRRSTASISPGSIRRPRIFTWSSARPSRSSVPSGRQRTRSPVRYIRSPGRAERVGDEALRRQGRLAEVAAGQARAGQVELAGHAGRHRPQALVEHVGAGVFQPGAPIGTVAGTSPDAA